MNLRRCARLGWWSCGETVAPRRHSLNVIRKSAGQLASRQVTELMSEQWQDCVVAHFDMVGIKDLSEDSQGSRLMMQMFEAVSKVADAGLPAVRHIYAWNDSLLTVSLLDGGGSQFKNVLTDLERLKTAADQVRKTYVVVVKGQSFPYVEKHPASSTTFHVLRASSWAMANCFLIEERLGKKHKAAWYVDSWVVQNVPGLAEHSTCRVALLPKRNRRAVHVFSHGLWPSGTGARS